MTEKNYIFADVPVTISAHDPYVTRMCREYEAETPGVRIEATPEEIERADKPPAKQPTQSAGDAWKYV